MKLIFLQYILTRKEETLMHKFLMAQRNIPTKGDWYSYVSNILEDFEINLKIEDLKNVPVNIFKRMVKQVSGLKYLKCQQIFFLKGARIKYDCLELQDYLKPSSNISIEDQRIIFGLRCEMNILKSNFKRNRSINEKYCIKACMKEIDNEHLIYCRELNGKSEINYEYVLNGSMQQKVEVLNQVKLNEEKRMNKKAPL